MRLQCPYCGVGCGMRVEVSTEGMLSVRADREHPTSRGELCIKPLHIAEILGKGRITTPMFREGVDKPFRKISWQEAYSILKDVLMSSSPEQVYFYISGQLLTEEIYVINKFVKGFLRTNNIDANTRLCMASSISAFRRVFGSDRTFGSYADIDDADTFLFVGSNAAISHPVLFRRVLKRRIEGHTRIITIDPVYTETASANDVHIPLRAGTDTVLFNAVLGLLYRTGRIDKGFIGTGTEGFEDALRCAQAYPVDVAGRICRIDGQDIEFLANVFAESRKLITFWCQGINQSASGTMKNFSILNLHLATARLDSKRGFPFPLTGQCNAMGGRLMGYLTEGLPGYRRVSDKADRSFMERFWSVGGIKGVPGLTITEAVDRMVSRDIRFLWVVGTNPAVSLPGLGLVQSALERVFLVVQDPYFNDTARYANMLLPAAQLGEKSGTMISGDRTITYCERFSEPHAEAKPDWRVFVEMAQKMGWREPFGFSSPQEIFLELKETTRDTHCDLSGLDYSMLPSRLTGESCKEAVSSSSSGKAVFIPATFSVRDGQKGFVLITGRLKRHWHTMTKTGKVESLVKGEPPPYVVMNYQDALKLGVSEWDTVRLTSRLSSTERVVIIGRIKRGHLFTPFGYPEEFCTPINTLVATRVDPLSGQPELKYTPVDVEKVPS